MELLHSDLTDAILKAFYDVYNELGYGFLEKVYENSLVIELHKKELNVRQQYPIKVFYEKQTVGEYFADLLVNELVIVELKGIEKINIAHEAQLTNYLKATNIEVGLILNFGPKPEFKRKIFSNSRKANLKGN